MVEGDGDVANVEPSFIDHRLSAEPCAFTPSAAAADPADASGASDTAEVKTNSLYRGRLQSDLYEARRVHNNKQRSVRAKQKAKERKQAERAAQQAGDGSVSAPQPSQDAEVMPGAAAPPAKGVAKRSRGRLAEVLAGVGGPLPSIAIECTFALTAPTLKEVRSLMKQAEYAVVANKNAEQPLPLALTGFSGQVVEVGKVMGAPGWPVLRHECPVAQAFPGKQLVIMSPDAEAALLPKGGEPLNPQAVYVVGGIVDRTVRKGLTLEYAAAAGLTAVRLPVLEYAAELGLGKGTTKRPVLNVNDVVVALLEYHRTGGDWVAALDKALPARKKKPHVQPNEPAKAQQQDQHGHEGPRDDHDGETATSIVDQQQQDGPSDL